MNDLRIPLRFQPNGLHANVRSSGADADLSAGSSLAWTRSSDKLGCSSQTATASQDFSCSFSRGMKGNSDSARLSGADKLPGNGDVASANAGIGPAATDNPLPEHIHMGRTVYEQMQLYLVPRHDYGLRSVEIPYRGRFGNYAFTQENRPGFIHFSCHNCTPNVRLMELESGRYSSSTTNEELARSDLVALLNAASREIKLQYDF